MFKKLTVATNNILVAFYIYVVIVSRSSKVFVYEPPLLSIYVVFYFEVDISSI